MQQQQLNYTSEFERSAANNTRSAVEQLATHYDFALMAAAQYNQHVATGNNYSQQNNFNLENNNLLLSIASTRTSPPISAYSQENQQVADAVVAAVAARVAANGTSYCNL